ncbi:MAG: hypothetical protein L6Q57_01750 [Alphaproteobacteria bacterium]|nr:hypothetical protein [Alphaproteobacteria bacterium]
MRKVFLRFIFGIGLLTLVMHVGPPTWAAQSKTNTQKSSALYNSTSQSANSKVFAASRNQKGQGKSFGSGGSAQGNPGGDMKGFDGGSFTTGIESSYDSKTRKVRMIDSTNGAVLQDDTDIIDSGNSPDNKVKKVYDLSWDFTKDETALEPSDIQFKPKPDGYDVTVTLVNTTDKPQRMGTLWVDNMPFGKSVHFRDFNYLFKPTETWGTATMSDKGYWLVGGRTYPVDAYSPILLLKGDLPDAQGRLSSYTIGVSLQYPIMEYGHDVRVALQRVKGKTRVGFHSNPKYCGTAPPCNGKFSASYNPTLDIPPYDAKNPTGHIRRYTLSVRVLRDKPEYETTPEQEWLYTLEPYRQYFQTLYGAPRYARNPAPVIGNLMAIQSRVSTASPHGFTTERPDLNGWELIVKDLWYKTTPAPKGLDWMRSMLWAPTGIAPTPEGNYHYKFTSHWDEIINPFGARPMRDTKEMLAEYGLAHQGLGLWWGRSMKVMSSWESASYESFDQYNLVHRKAAFKELEGARYVSATTIGLDEFAHGPGGARWITEMQTRYPGMRFVTESVRADFMNVMAANFMEIKKYPFGTDQSHCKNPVPAYQPMVMADFLMPGLHETWLFGQVGAINKYEKVQPSFKRLVPKDLQKPYYPVLTKQPANAVGACFNTVTLKTSAFSPRGRALQYEWYFYPRKANPAADIPPARMKDGQGLLRVLTSDGSNPADRKNYKGARANTLTVVVNKETVGTYRLRVREQRTTSGWTWSEPVSVTSTLANQTCP